MINVTPDQIPYIANRLSVDRALTTEQAAAVKTLVGGSDYTGLTHEEIVVKLATPYQTANPTPQPILSRDSIANKDLYNALATHGGQDTVPYIVKIEDLAAVPLADSTELNIFCKSLVSVFRSQVEFIDLNTPSAQAMATTLVPALVDQPTADLIFKYPDPSWVAEVEMASPLEQLGFGQGAVLSVRDLEGALA